MTSLHALITFCTTFALFLKEGDVDTLPEGMMRTLSVGNTGIMIYCAMIGSTLLAFGLYTLCLMTSNITSNENLRNRYNAAKYNFDEKQRKKLKFEYENLDAREMEILEEFKRDDDLAEERNPGWFSKVAYFFTKELPKSNVEVYMRIKDELGGTTPEDYKEINNAAILESYGIEVQDE